jgi:hypothetical protein
MVFIANDCGYKLLRFGANPQKYQTLVPAKNSHLEVLNLINHEYWKIWQLGDLPWQLPN